MGLRQVSDGKIGNVGTATANRPNAEKPGSGARAPDPGNEVRDVLSAPPGTRTPNPRIKSAEVPISANVSRCRPVPFFVALQRLSRPTWAR